MSRWLVVGILLGLAVVAGVVATRPEPEAESPVAVDTDGEPSDTATRQLLREIGYLK